MNTDINQNTGDWNTGDWNTGDWNTGRRNTGDWNTGYWNTGRRNTGDKNTGDQNTGDWNTGDWNTGEQNTGKWNTGNWNTGDHNTGNWNTGNWNTGNQNTGFFNTTTQTVRMFNKDTWLLPEEVPKFPDFLFFDLTEWICSEDMTSEEKKTNKEHKIVGGYLKEYGYKEAFQKSFKERATEEQINQLKSLPCFDAEVFYEISGIDLREKKKVVLELTDHQIESLKDQGII